MLITIIIVAAAGLAASIYAYLLEQKIKTDPTHKPACDISDKMSCTKPILSEYGKLLGVSNSLLGIAFYSSIIMFAFLGASKLIFLGAIGACISSVYLAWILYTKIKSLCLICIFIYLINALLLILSYWSVKY